MSIHVYYLDDEPALCAVFKEFLEDEQITVSTFTKADEAIYACRSTAPDLMFIDYRLSETTGIDVAKILDNTIPKVLVTGELSEPESDLFLKIIAKPYKLSELKEFVLSNTSKLSR